MNRTDVLDYLVRHHSQWPTTREEALYASRDDGHPTASQDVWWSCANSRGEMVLCFAGDFDSITHEEWSQARRERLNRPEDWPAGARILVQNRNGVWVFGTMEHANPHDEYGGWTPDFVENSGTWLIEGRTQGSTEIAGWDWTCSMVTREDAMIDSLDYGEPEEIEEKVEGAAPEWMVEPSADAHYAGMVLRIDLTEVDRQRGYAEVRLDPYRMADFYGIGGGPREQVFKKAIRGTSKGHSELQVIDDIRAAVDRWEQMVLEGYRIRRV